MARLKVILLIGLLFFLHCRPETPLLVLEQEVTAAFRNGQGVFSMAFKDLQSGEEILINGDDSFHAASTMKTPVMIEVYKQAEQGFFDLKDSLQVVNEFYSIVDSSTYSLNSDEDSEKTLYDLIGQKKMISDLVYDMIIVSSNLATNIVIGLVDARQVTETMRSFGAENILVLRGVEDMLAYERGLSNRTTARDLMTIYEALALRKVVSARASDEMIEILKDQRFGDIIPAHLPRNIEVAHKTGVITGLHHDSGIVYLPDGRKYVLVLLSRDLQDFDEGTQLLASISKMVYDYMKS
ncbi:MAG: class A beta-lactamase-related serine hydrolase [Saprospiraceae bacterium]|nr:class A beta-lactamase-related serine hydrolase [Saprospiraceae bacterium]